AGTTKEQAVAYFKKKGIGAAPAPKQPRGRRGKYTADDVQEVVPPSGGPDVASMFRSLPPDKQREYFERMSPEEKVKLYNALTASAAAVNEPRDWEPVNKPTDSDTSTPNEDGIKA